MQNDINDLARRMMMKPLSRRQNIVAMCFAQQQPDLDKPRIMLAVAEWQQCGTNPARRAYLLGRRDKSHLRHNTSRIITNAKGEVVKWLKRGYAVHRSRYQYAPMSMFRGA
jgi:hypothetical protein